jgi:hypothetical protein
MGKGPCAFKLSDVTRLVKAVVKAGVEVARVEADKDGSGAIWRIVVVAGKPVEANGVDKNEWDEIDGTAPAALRRRVQ